MLLLIFAGIIVVLTYYVLRFIKLKSFFKEKGVKYLEPLPILGNSLPFASKKVSMVDYINNLYYTFPNERYMGMFNFHQPVLMLRDLDLIKQVTIKSFENFTDHSELFPGNVDRLWGKNLFASTGDRWFSLRRTLSPAFTGSKIKTMFGLIDACAADLISYFDEQKKDVLEFEMKDIFSRFTNDVIATSAFGVHLNTNRDRNNEFFTLGKSIVEFKGLNKFKFFLTGIPEFILKALNIKIINDETGNFFRTIISETIHKRETEHIIRPDLIHLLMEAKKGRQNEVKDEKTKKYIELNEEDMTAQALVFFIGGFETTSGLLSFVMYELCANPNIQEKLRQEIDETYKSVDGKITYDALMKMKYIDMVITETLRMWPQAAPFLDRVVTKPFTIEPVKAGEKPVHLNVGDVCWVPNYSIQRDPKYYEDPDTFNPERFSEENKHKIHPEAYLPFGTGPRNCIGSRYALMVNKLMVYYLLKSYTIVKSPKTKIPLTLDTNNLVVSPKDGFWFGFQKR